MYDGVLELIFGIKKYYDGARRMERTHNTKVTIVGFPTKYFQPILLLIK